MIFNLNNPYEHDKFKAYVNKLYAEHAVVEVKKKLPGRTLSQNRYFYLLLSWFAIETGYSADEVKVDIFKRKCNADLFVRQRENRKGETVTYLRSSSELTTGEMTAAIERFRNYASAEAGIYLPAPGEREALIHIEQEIERNKEFL